MREIIGRIAYTIIDSQIKSLDSSKIFYKSESRKRTIYLIYTQVLSYCVFDCVHVF